MPMGLGLGLGLGALGSPGFLPDFPYPTFPETVLWDATTVAKVDTSGLVSAITDAATSSDNPYGNATAPRLTFNAGTGQMRPYTALSVGVDVSGGGSIRVAFRPVLGIIPGSGFTTWTLRIASGTNPASIGSDYHQAGTATNFNRYSTAPDASNPGSWQYISFPVNAFTVAGAGANLSSIKIVNIAARGLNGTQIELGKVTYVPNPRTKAALIFRFDDCYASAYNVALPLMQANAAPAYGFLAPGAPNNTGGGTAIGQSGRLTYPMISALCAAGWQIGTQSWDTEDTAVLEAMTDDQLRAQWAGARSVGYNVGRRRDTYDTTNNSRSTILRRTKDVAFRTNQGFYDGDASNPPIPYGETFPFADPRQIICLNMNSPGGTPKSTYVGYAIDQVIASKGVLILACHDELAAGSGTTYDAFVYALGRLVSDAATIESPQYAIRGLLAPYNSDTLVG